MLQLMTSKSLFSTLQHAQWQANHAKESRGGEHPTNAKLGLEDQDQSHQCPDSKHNVWIAQAISSARSAALRNQGMESKSSSYSF